MAMRSTPWAQAVAELSARGEAFALATLVDARGSTPRSAGSKMVITQQHSYDSIGGGGLEYLVSQRARALLSEGVSGQCIEAFPLGAAAAQCCGGAVSVLLELFPGARDRVAVFGAGHVARALMPVLAQLPLSLSWYDNRPELLEDCPPALAGVRRRVLADPVDAVRDLADDSLVLILTHDHALDYRLVHTLLSDWRWRFVGLIGSATKAQRFRDRLRRDAIAEDRISQLCCPVGLPGVGGKLPMQVAIAIAAQVVAITAAEEAAASTPALDWRHLRDLLKAPDHG